FNGAVARTRRRRAELGEGVSTDGLLQWSRRANATETEDFRVNPPDAEQLQWSRRANATETCRRRGWRQRPELWLQWSRRANATETCVTLPRAYAVKSALQWSRRANATETARFGKVSAPM